MSSNTDADRAQSALSADPDDYPSDAALDDAKEDVRDYVDRRDYYVLLSEVWEHCDADPRTVTVAIEELQAQGVLETQTAVRRSGGGPA